VATYAGSVVFEALLVGNHRGRWLGGGRNGGGAVALEGTVGGGVLGGLRNCVCSVGVVVVGEVHVCESLCKSE